MKWQGSKQAAAYREHGPAREAFLEEFEWQCKIPGCTRGDGVAVHEIMNGPNRMRAFGVRAAWLPACSFCNCSVLTDKHQWPLADQLALKLLIDPAYFDLDAIRKIAAAEGSSKIPILVTEADVLYALRQLLVERNAA